MIESRGPPVAVRLLMIVAAWWFAAIPHNPVVRLEAILGLSPSSLEKLVGIRGPFSGMTEGFHQLARGNFFASVRANILSPAVAVVFLVCLFTWSRPRIQSRRQEAAFFIAACGATVVVNIWH